MEWLFHAIWIGLAVHILLNSFWWRLYYRIGLPVLRLRRPARSDPAPQFPDQKQVEACFARAHLRELEVHDFGVGLYGFRRRNRAGPALFQGVIRLSSVTPIIEVQGRIALPLAVALGSAGVALFGIVADQGDYVALVITVAVLSMFVVRDYLVCRKVAFAMTTLR